MKKKRKINICRPVTNAHGIIAQLNIHWLEQTVPVFICLIFNYEVLKFNVVYSWV